MKIKIKDKGYKFVLKIDSFELFKIGMTPNDLTELMKSVCEVTKNKKKGEDTNVSN